jgi:predicted nucleotidyltransferase
MSADQKDATIASALFGKARRTVLALFYGHPDQSFYMRQIVRAAGVGLGAVQRELTRLAEAAVIVRKVQGRQVYYQANRHCPIFAELHGLVIKTAGLADVIRTALTPLAERIVLAFVHGSFARGQERSGSDVDLVVVGDVSFGEVVSALAAAQEQLAREINPAVYPVAEFRQKLASGHHFLTAVMKQPKTVLMGDVDEFARLASQRMAGRAQDKPRRNRQPARRRRP